MNPRKHCTSVIWVHEELDRLRKFHDLMEETLKRRELARSGSWRASAATGTGLPAGQLERSSDQNDLHKKLRYSVVIHLFSTLEVQSPVMCDEIRMVQNTALQVSDLKGSLMDRIQTYLDRACRVFPANDARWELLRWLEKLRHLIVHNAGEIPSRQMDTWRALASRGKGISIDNAQQIFLSEAFCRGLIDHTQSWFDSVYGAAGLSYEPWKDLAL